MLPGDSNVDSASFAPGNSLESASPRGFSISRQNISDASRVYRADNLTEDGSVDFDVDSLALEPAVTAEVELSVSHGERLPAEKDMGKRSEEESLINPQSIFYDVNMNNAFMSGSKSSKPKEMHVIFLLHGIGFSDSELQRHKDEFKSSLLFIREHWFWNANLDFHVELINWKAAILEKQKKIFDPLLLSNMQHARRAVCYSAGDLLFFMTPAHGDSIVKNVVEQMNDHAAKISETFKEGISAATISLVGYSLGSIIGYEILAGRPLRPSGFNDSNKYPKVKFNIDNVFFMGSSLGPFLLLNFPEMLHEGFWIPERAQMYNIFHSHDPLAFRIEGLCYPGKALPRPVLLPHWENKGTQDWYEWDKNIQHAKAIIQQNISGLSETLFKPLYGWWQSNGTMDSALLQESRREKPIVKSLFHKRIHINPRKSTDTQSDIERVTTKDLELHAHHNNEINSLPNPLKSFSSQVENITKNFRGSEKSESKSALPTEAKNDSKLERYSLYFGREKISPLEENAGKLSEVKGANNPSETDTLRRLSRKSLAMSIPKNLKNRKSKKKFNEESLPSSVWSLFPPRTYENHSEQCTSGSSSELSVSGEDTLVPKEHLMAIVNLTKLNSCDATKLPKRYDFQLQEDATEHYLTPLAFLQSHFNYWRSKDAALFMVHKITGRKPYALSFPAYLKKLEFETEQELINSNLTNDGTENQKRLQKRYQKVRNIIEAKQSSLSHSEAADKISHGAAPTFFNFFLEALGRDQ